jgi:superfamily II DNA/RNA helicase
MDSTVHFKFLTCALSDDEKVRYSTVGAEAYNSKHRAAYFSRLHSAADMPVIGDDLSTKEQLLLSLAKEIAMRGNPFIVYTAYIPTKDRIAYVMTKVGIPCVSITGSVSAKERARIANMLKVGEVCCVILTDAGLRGINLQMCETTIAYHIPFNILGIIQLLGRQCRIGSPYKENFFFFTIAQGTIDEYRENYMRRNIPLVKSVMTGCSVVLPDINDATLSKKDLEVMRGSMLWGNTPTKSRKKSTKSSKAICHA